MIDPYPYPSIHLSICVWTAFSRDAWASNVDILQDHQGWYQDYPGQIILQ